MTIAAAYLTSEGVVLGTDSTSTVSVRDSMGADAVVQLLEHSQKIFEIASPGMGRIALCTWGHGRVGKFSHRTIGALLAEKIEDAKTSIEEASHILAGIVQAMLRDMSERDRHHLGYYVGGWDPGTHHPRCFKMEFADGKDVAKLNELQIGEASFSGDFSYFSRVFRGFDPLLPDALYVELKKRCLSIAGSSEFEVAYREAFKTVAGQLVSAGYQDLPIREAIDYIHASLHVTIKARKFRYGPPPSGGPIEIAFVSTDRRFRWVCHKNHDSAIL